MRTDDIHWRPRSAPRALTELEKAANRLRDANDDRAVFLDVYIVITDKVVKTINTENQTRFVDPPMLSELTGRFAEEALLAVKSSLEQRPIVNAPWRLANNLAADKLLSPGQNALLGVNAHINYDLPLVVYEYLASDGRLNHPTRLERFRHDYFKVNDMLKECMPRCFEVLTSQYRCPLTETLMKVPLGRWMTSRLIMSTVIDWRKQVWHDAIDLLEAGEPERAALVNRIDRRSGRIARAIAGTQVAWRWLRRQPLPQLWNTADGRQSVALCRTAIFSITDLVLTGRTRGGKKLRPVQIR